MSYIFPIWDMNYWLKRGPYFCIIFFIKSSSLSLLYCIFFSFFRTCFHSWIIDRKTNESNDVSCYQIHSLRNNKKWISIEGRYITCSYDRGAHLFRSDFAFGSLQQNSASFLSFVDVEHCTPLWFSVPLSLMMVSQLKEVNFS